ncbi:hypothetical protein, partial [Pseudomonas baetica]|uniref:hypothetical protein n=1 Tax=Pseudomonas baetica TaxID=674054 RepID=UPI0028718E49
GDAVGDGWIEFRAKTMRYFLFDKSCGTLRSFVLDLKNQDQKIAASFHSTAPTAVHVVRESSNFLIVMPDNSA